MNIKNKDFYPFVYLKDKDDCVEVLFKDEELETGEYEEKQIDKAGDKAEINVKTKTPKVKDPKPTTRKETNQKVKVNPVPEYRGGRSGYVPNS